jgi:hypothetical protein
MQPYLCTADALGAWCTLFDKPKHFLGYPYDISTNLSPDLFSPAIGAVLRTNVVEYNRAGTVIDTSVKNEDAVLSAAQLVGTYRVALSEFAFNVNTAYYEVFLSIDDTNISETISIELVRPTCDGWYFRWLNPIGGWEGYFFDKGQEEQSITEETRYVSDIDSRIEKWAEIKNEEIVVGKESETTRTASTKSSEIKALKYIIRNPTTYVAAKAFERLAGISDMRDGESANPLPECEEKYQTVGIITLTDSLLTSKRGNQFDVAILFKYSIRERNQTI